MAFPPSLLRRSHRSQSEGAKMLLSLCLVLLDRQTHSSEAIKLLLACLSTCCCDYHLLTPNTTRHRSTSRQLSNKFKKVMLWVTSVSADVSGHTVSMSNGSGIPGGNYKEIKAVIGTCKLDDCCSVAGFKLEIT